MQQVLPAAMEQQDQSLPSNNSSRCGEQQTRAIMQQLLARARMTSTSTDMLWLGTRRTLSWRVVCWVKSILQAAVCCAEPRSGQGASQSAELVLNIIGMRMLLMSHMPQGIQPWGCQGLTKLRTHMTGTASLCGCLIHDVNLMVMTLCLQAAGAAGSMSRSKSRQLDRQHNVVVLGKDEQADLFKNTQLKHGCGNCTAASGNL